MTTDFNRDRSNWKHPRPSLSEILRPEALTDLTLPMPTIERLQRGIEFGLDAEFAILWTTWLGEDQRSKYLFKRHRMVLEDQSRV